MLFDSFGRQIVVGAIGSGGSSPYVEVVERGVGVITAVLVPGAILNVDGGRKIHLRVKANIQAALNEVVMIPMVSGLTIVPQTIDDSWYPFFESNESAYDADIDAGVGLPAGGPPFTKGPNWRQVILEPLMFRLKAGTAAPQVVRGRWTLDVEGEKWFQIVLADAGAGAPLTKIGISATVTA